MLRLHQPCCRKAAAFRGVVLREGLGLLGDLSAAKFDEAVGFQEGTALRLHQPCCRKAAAFRSVVLREGLGLFGTCRLQKSMKLSVFRKARF